MIVQGGSAPLHAGGKVPAAPASGSMVGLVEILKIVTPSLKTPVTTAPFILKASVTAAPSMLKRPATTSTKPPPPVETMSKAPAPLNVLALATRPTPPAAAPPNPLGLLIQQGKSRQERDSQMGKGKKKQTERQQQGEDIEMTDANNMRKGKKVDKGKHKAQEHNQPELKEL